ncbi:MAG TPA: nuclear transport factor 2 family protein [Acidimicrobiales bacterium]|nr:nuclear transport factor 2 family protein [Acidimicrobiales bacterium]
MTNLERLERFYALARDWYAQPEGTPVPAELSDLLDPALVIREPASLPYGGTFHGIEGHADLSARTGAFWDFDQMVPAEYVCEGDVVVALNRMTGRVRSTGTPVDMPLIAVWRFRDGRILSADIFPFDTHEILLGAGL